MFVAEGLLAVDQHHVGAPTGQSPVLEAVIQQQGVAAEMLHGVAAGLDPVLVDQHHHVPQVGGQHVGFVPGGLGVEQERLAVGDDPRGRGVLAQQDLVEQPLRHGLRTGAVPAGQDRHLASGILQRPREFLHDRSLSGAAHREVAHRDDLHAQRRVAQDAYAVEQASQLHDAGEEVGQHREQRPDERRLAPREILEDHRQQVGLGSLSEFLPTLAHRPSTMSSSGRDGKISVGSDEIRLSRAVARDYLKGKLPGRGP